MIIIAAMSSNRVIGKDGSIPWHCPEDLKFFKEETLNQTVIMGRKTWDSLPKKPLPNRTNIVCSKSDKAFYSYVPIIKGAYVIGGESIYKRSLPYCTKIILRLFPFNVKGGDSFMPEFEHEFYVTNTVKEIVTVNGRRVDSRIIYYGKNSI